MGISLFNASEGFCPFYTFRASSSKSTPISHSLLFEPASAGKSYAIIVISGFTVKEGIALQEAFG